MTGAPTITFRRLRADDLPMFHDWLGRPHVAQWWGPQRTLDEVRDEYTSLTDDSTTTKGYVAIANGEPIAFVQSYVAKDSGDGWWTDETDPGVRGIDQFLCNAEQLGQGLGTAVVRAFVDLLFTDPSVTRVQTDPSPDNARAIRCYEKSGFLRVREIDTPDGRALFMIRERADRGQSLTSREFRALLDSLADAWMRLDYVAATDVFADDVRYADPLRYAFHGRAALRAFFEADDGLPQRTVWHTVIFDEVTQTGAAEYTYDGSARYHGVTVIRVHDRKITHWREHQHIDARAWEEFARATTE